MLSILLADDHDVVRRGLRAMLDSHPGWQVCGEAVNGRQAVKLAGELKPQVAVLDLEMPELNGLEATRQIKKELPNVEVLIYTMFETERLIRDVIAAGARGYVLKSDAGQHLIEAIEALSRHKPFFTAKASETLLDNFLKSPQKDAESSVLTDREREIVQLLAEGKANKEIASILGISVKTVETHRAAIMRKTEINSIVELVHYAIRNNLVKP
ncbi:MAG TPA: response regulator transcription factor [Terriglobia bacterium]|nr:response regulator transcription factor [Terriglobia bacterium]